MDMLPPERRDRLESSDVRVSRGSGAKDSGTWAAGVRPLSITPLFWDAKDRSSYAELARDAGRMSEPQDSSSKANSFWGSTARAMVARVVFGCDYVVPSAAPRRAAARAEHLPRRLVHEVGRGARGGHRAALRARRRSIASPSGGSCAPQHGLKPQGAARVAPTASATPWAVVAHPLAHTRLADVLSHAAGQSGHSILLVEWKQPMTQS